MDLTMSSLAVHSVISASSTMKKATIFLAICVIADILSPVHADAGPGLIEWTNFLTKAEQVCINSTQIDADVIDRTKLELELPNDPQYKKYISCFYRKQGYQNEDGDILFYNIRNMITDLANGSVAIDIVNQCKDIERTASNEDHAYIVAKCLLAASKSKLPQPQSDGADEE